MVADSTNASKFVFHCAFTYLLQNEITHYLGGGEGYFVQYVKNIGFKNAYYMQLYFDLSLGCIAIQTDLKTNTYFFAHNDYGSKYDPRYVFKCIFSYSLICACNPSVLLVSIFVFQ